MKLSELPSAALAAVARRSGRGAYRIGEALGDRVLVGRTPGGSPIALSMRDHQQRHLFFHGEYEPEVTALFRRVITPGSIVFDVGANVGYFSILSRELGASVHSFEPNPATRALLNRSVALGPGGIEVVPCACSERAGKMPLYLPGPRETGRAGLMVARASSVEVEVITLDDYVERHDVHPQFVKIDVEGAEGAVLRGMSELLRVDRPTLIIELHVTRGETEHATHGEVEALLEAADYELEPIESNDPDSKVPVRSHILARAR